MVPQIIGTCKHFAGASLHGLTLCATGALRSSCRSFAPRLFVVPYTAYSLEEAEGDTRFAFNAVVHADDWTDTYLPAFQACVQDAGVHSIMCRCVAHVLDSCSACIILCVRDFGSATWPATTL